MPLVQTPATERNGTISPDGRWLAYEASDSGQLEIHVRPFPEVKTGHWKVSTAGGTRPLWARNGQELFYLGPDGALMRVGVERGATWAATAPTKLLEGRSFSGWRRRQRPGSHLRRVAGRKTVSAGQAWQWHGVSCSRPRA